MKKKLNPPIVLFDENQPEQSLYDLAAAYGDRAVFQMVRFCRDTRPAGNLAGNVQHTLARRMVDERCAAGLTEDEARRDVADDLGYPARARTNFYALLAGLARTSYTPQYTDGDRDRR